MQSGTEAAKPDFGIVQNRLQKLPHNHKKQVQKTSTKR